MGKEEKSMPIILHFGRVIRLYDQPIPGHFSASFVLFVCFSSPSTRIISRSLDPLD